jgi:hypothetical protein
MATGVVATAFGVRNGPIIATPDAVARTWRCHSERVLPRTDRSRPTDRDSSALCRRRMATQPPAFDHLHRRRAEGFTNAAQLYAEIRALGYRGGEP